MPREDHPPSHSKRRRVPALQREFDFGFAAGHPVLPERAPPQATPEFSTPGDEELTHQAQVLLKGIGELHLAQTVRVSWNPRLRSTAGRAYRARNEVELNPALLTVSRDEIDRTLRHELAHLVAYRRARKKRIEPHGPEWRTACGDLGIPGEARCHTLDLPRTRQRRLFAYVCRHCGREIRRARRIRVQVACFSCCKTHNQGRFSAAFALQERPLTPEEESF